MTKVGFGRFQAEIVEEEHYFYMDTDVIIQQAFEWEYPTTISTEYKIQPVNKNIKGIKQIEIMRNFILDRGGKTEIQKDFILFADAIFFSNKELMLKILHPKIIEISVEYIKKNIEQRWFDMQYFHSANCLLKQKK